MAGFDETQQITIRKVKSEAVDVPQVDGEGSVVEPSMYNGMAEESQAQSRVHTIVERIHNFVMTASISQCLTTAGRTLSHRADQLILIPMRLENGKGHVILAAFLTCLEQALGMELMDFINEKVVMNVDIFTFIVYSDAAAANLWAIKVLHVMFFLCSVPLNCLLLMSVSRLAAIVLGINSLKIKTNRIIKVG